MQLNKKIIFVVGNSRSGTTMMSRILGLNQNVHTLQEIHFFEWMIASQDLNKSISENNAIILLNKLIGIQVESFYEQTNLLKYTEESKNIIATIKDSSYSAIDVYYYFLMYWTKKNNKKFPCEQTPKNLYYIDEILDNFEHAKIIHMVRDPRSILLSQKNKWKRKFLGEKEMPFFESIRAWTLYHPITIAKLWTSAINTTDNYDSTQVLTIKFEELLTNPEQYILKICTYCEIDFDKKMLDVPQVGSSIAKDEPNKQGIDHSKSSTWDKGAISDTELYLMQKIAKTQMEKLGYRIEKLQVNYLYLFYLYITFPIKISVAILLNMGRMKNIIETLKRRMK